MTFLNFGKSYNVPGVTVGKADLIEAWLHVYLFFYIPLQEAITILF